jgi:hypothetical protein
MSRIDLDDDSRPSDEALHRAGWSIGDTACHGGAGWVTWLVWGSNGENLIRAEGATRDEAWGRAVEQARAWGHRDFRSRGRERRIHNPQFGTGQGIVSLPPVEPPGISQDVVIEYKA